jgi:predicted nucleic acid-binding protein
MANVERDMMIAANALSATAVPVTNNSPHYDRIASPLILAN